MEASVVRAAGRVIQHATLVFRVETYAYRRPAIFDGKGYRKLDVEDEEERAFKGSYVGGWLAALQHHFVAAAVPPPQASYDYQLSLNAQNDFTLGYRGPLTTVANGATQSFNETLFVGPKLGAGESGHRAEKRPVANTEDHGIAAVVLVTIEGQLRTQLGPGDHHRHVPDQARVLQADRRERPLDGEDAQRRAAHQGDPGALQGRPRAARPADDGAVQAREDQSARRMSAHPDPDPVLPGVLLGAARERRDAPGAVFAWITDLSVRDPYFILPILMGAAMFAQFKLQPMPSTDPMQAKVFAFMPVIMAVTMAWFPAGLVLYWLTNTLLSIAQQWRINKLVAAEQQHAKT